MTGTQPEPHDINNAMFNYFSKEDEYYGNGLMSIYPNKNQWCQGNVCSEFMIDENSLHHKHEAKDKERVWSMMFYSSNDESCAVVGTDDEIAILLTDDTISNTFVMIGESASQWEDDKQREELCDNALARIKERDNKEVIV